MRKNPVKPTSRVYEGGLNRLKPGGFFWVGFYPNNPGKNPIYRSIGRNILVANGQIKQEKTKTLMLETDKGSEFNLTCS